MIRFVAAIVAGALLAACAARATPASSSRFTPEQRAEVIQIMRDAMKKDPSILRDAVIAVQADNDRIEAQARHQVLANHQDTLFGSRDPSIGNPRASTTIVEFYDPRCPYCRQLAPLLQHFVASDGDIRLVYKDLPILGPASELGSRALLAADRQGGYEALRARIMQVSPDGLSLAAIRDAAAGAGLNWTRLQNDMSSAAVAKELAANKQLAADLGIDGTPALVIGQKIVEGADMPTIVATVATARHDRSRDRSQAAIPMSTSAR